MKKLLFLLLFLLPFLGFSQTAELMRIGQTRLSIVNFNDYPAAVGDSSTDNTTVFRTAIAATPDGGQLFISKPGIYLVTDTLLLSKRISIIGVGGLGSGTTGGITQNPSVVIGIISTTKNIFVINANQCQLRNIGVFNFTSGTPTAGHGILINKGVGFRQQDVTVSGFYINEEIVNGYLWDMGGCHWLKPVVNNLIVRDLATPDNGDSNLHDSWFYGGFTDNMDHILYTSGGGLKINNVKFNSSTLSHNPRHCINALFSASTVDLLITNCSFENFTGDAIKLKTAGGVTFSDVVIHGNQITPGGLWTATGGSNIIETDPNISNVIITGNDFYNGVNGVFSSGTYSGWNIVSLSPNTTISGNGYNGTVTDNISIQNRSGLNYFPPTRDYTYPTTSVPTVYINRSNNQLINVTSNTTVGIDTSLYSAPFMLRLLQDGTGGHTVTFDGNCAFLGQKTFDLSANSYTVIRGYFDRATNKVELSIVNSPYLGVFTTTGRNALTGLVAGNTCYDSTLNALFYYDGSAWQQQTTTTTGVGLTTANVFTNLNTFQKANLTTNPLDAVYIQNPTLSTSGVPVQVSPYLDWGGNVWNTTVVAAPNYFHWRMYADGASGTTPTSTFHIQGSLNNSDVALAQDRLLIDNSGKVTLPNYASLTGQVFFPDVNGKIINSGNFIFDATNNRLGVLGAPTCTLDGGATTSTTNYNFRTAAWLLQSYASNNTYLTNNAYINGSLTRPSNDYSAGIHIYHGQLMLFGAATGSGALTETNGFKHDYANGNTVSLGGTIDQANGSVIGATMWVSGSQIVANQPIIQKTTPVAINATATATAANMGSGYIKSTSAAATTITFTTATLLATQLATAGQGTIFPLIIDNTAGANTVTLVLGTGMTLLNSGSLTVPSGATGIAKFEFVITSSSTCTVQRVY